MTDRRLARDMRTLTEDERADRSGRAPLGAAPARTPLAGSTGEATDQDLAETGGTATTGAGNIWDLNVLEAWGDEYVLLDSTGAEVTNGRLVEYDRFRVRDGAGNEGTLFMNITTRINNITPAP